MKYFLTILAAISFSMGALFAQEADESEGTENKENKEAKKEEPKKKPIRILFFFKGDKKPLRLNYPKMLYAPDKRKMVVEKSDWASARETRNGIRIVQKVKQGNASYETAKKIEDTVKIIWTENDPILDEAANELARGNAAGALEIAERFLKFFAPLKEIEGSPWLNGAIIKLDALNLQENDVVLDMFIREIESTPNTDKIPGLSQKIKLARLDQLVRKGENNQVVNTCDSMISSETDTEILARLYLIKGNALFNLIKYEDALYTFLKIPVFCGNQATALPKAKLGIALSLRKMDNPDNKEMKLYEVSDNYLIEILNEYSRTPEAKEALKLLPKEKREANKGKDVLEEAEKSASLAAEVDKEQAEIQAEPEKEEAEGTGDDSTSTDTESDGASVDVDAADAE